MKHNEDTKQDNKKGILLTGSKQNTSKARRVSWGGHTTKEFHNDVVTATNDDINNNILNHIQEEASSSKEYSVTESNNTTNIKDTTFINQKPYQSVNRLTMQHLNLNEIMAINQSDKENIPERVEKPNSSNRITIGNLDTYMAKKPSVPKENNKRITLNLKASFDIFNAGNKEEIMDDDVEMIIQPFANKNNTTIIENHQESPLKGNQMNIDNKDMKITMSPIRRQSLTEKSIPPYNNNTNTNYTPKDKRLTIMTLQEQFHSVHSLKKNPTITNNLITTTLLPNSSKPKQNSMIINEKIEDVEKRIQEYTQNLEETNLQKKNEFKELQKDIQSIQSKLNEFHIENDIISQQKLQSLDKISQLSNQFNHIKQVNIINKIFETFFETKVIQVKRQTNTVDLLLLNRMHLYLSIGNLSSLLEGSKQSQNNNLLDTFIILSSEDFLLTSKNPSDKNQLLYHENTKGLLKTIYNEILQGILPCGKIGFSDFRYRLKKLLKLTASYVYMFDTLNIIFTVGSDIEFKYEREKGLVKVKFDILNKQGFKVKFQFDISIINSFQDITLTGMESINTFMPQVSFSKLQNKFFMLKNEIEKYLGLKDPRNLTTRNFFFILEDNISKL